MWHDIQRVHGIGPKFIHRWGARSYYQFYHSAGEYLVRLSQRSRDHQAFNIGYAAAFCDEMMGKNEIAVIKKIAEVLCELIPQAIIHVRPYPILPSEFYRDIEKHANVRVVGIAGPKDVYQNGKYNYEYRKGNVSERCDYLANCDCFLSIATSFTFEAAIFGIPIVHFQRSPEQCDDQAEREFFSRLAISDHLHYFTKNLPTACSYQQLAAQLKEIMHCQKKFGRNSAPLLESIGIPLRVANWDSQTERLAEGIRILGTDMQGSLPK